MEFCVSNTDLNNSTFGSQLSNPGTDTFREQDQHELNIFIINQIPWSIVGNTIEVLGSTKARLLFKKYDRLYGDHTKNGPLIDPRKYDESLLNHYHKYTSLKHGGKDKGFWRGNWTSFKYC